MKLQKILEHYENPQMRLAVRNIRNRAIAEAKAPQSGAYWWLPTPDGKWELDIYYDSEFRGNTMHDIMWRKYVLDRLAILWNKDPAKLKRSIGYNYAGLPRGRIGRAPSTGFVISHGDDAPIKNGMKKILSAFNLSGLVRSDPKKVKITVDKHETMLAGDPEIVQKALGVDLGLEGSFGSSAGIRDGMIMDLDDHDDNYYDDHNHDYDD
jgi:hypothetical protein